MRPLSCLTGIRYLSMCSCWWISKSRQALIDEKIFSLMADDCKWHFFKKKKKCLEIKKRRV